MTSDASNAEYQEVGVTNILPKSTALIALEISARGAIIRDLNQNIARNEYGLPDYIYRVDLLPSGNEWEQMEPHSRLNSASNAELGLDYSQGFAALPTGEAFWSKLDHEGPGEFMAFSHYLAMPRAKADGHVPVAPVRQLNLLKPITGKTSVELLDLSYQYYWPDRARAFDLYTLACHVKNKELRTVSVEDEQFERAGRYIAFAEDFLAKVFADPESYELTPKEAFDMIWKMQQAQRLAVGLNPTGQHSAKDENKVAPNANLEVIMRTIAKNSGAISDEGQSQGNVMQKLLSDPAAFSQAQELIIRMGDIKSPRSQKHGDHFDE